MSLTHKSHWIKQTMIFTPTSLHRDDGTKNNGNIDVASRHLSWKPKAILMSEAKTNSNPSSGDFAQKVELPNQKH